MNHEKWENVTGTSILIIVGVCAGTVSFNHVIAWTVLYGQSTLAGVVNALVTELLQIAGGLEIKRRRRNGRTGWRAFWFPSLVLGIACAMSLTAQLSQASPSWQGRLVATLPMIGFLFTVKLVMGRSPAQAAEASAVPVDAPPQLVVETVPDESPVRPEPSIFVNPVPSPQVTHALIDAPSRPVPSRPDVAAVPAGRQATLDLEPVRTRTAEPRPSRPVNEPTADVRAIADEIYAELTRDGGRATRDRFADELRDRGFSMSNSRAGVLLNTIRQELIPA